MAGTQHPTNAGRRFSAQHRRPSQTRTRHLGHAPRERAQGREGAAPGDPGNTAVRQPGAEQVLHRWVWRQGEGERRGQAEVSRGGGIVVPPSALILPLEAPKSQFAGGPSQILFFLGQEREEGRSPGSGTGSCPSPGPRAEASSGRPGIHRGKRSQAAQGRGALPPGATSPSGILGPSRRGRGCLGPGAHSADRAWDKILCSSLAYRGRRAS